MMTLHRFSFTFKYPNLESLASRYIADSRNDPDLAARLELADIVAITLERLIQDQDKELTDVAFAAITGAQAESKSGPLLDGAVDILSKLWKYGRELAAWYRTHDGQRARRRIVSQALIAAARPDTHAAA